MNKGNEQMEIASDKIAQELIEGVSYEESLGVA
jgi:hypothetical protein